MEKNCGNTVGWTPQSVRRRRSVPRAGGFTLMELLIVVVIMAVMAGLMVPAVRGLVGVQGKRGGMNTLASVLEQARLTAMQNGVPAYVGFPFGAPDPELAHSSVIVLRKEKEGEAPGLKPVSRWMRMPRGIYIESENLSETLPSSTTIPLLGGQNAGQLTVLAFDRFGKLIPDTEPAVIRVGEKSAPAPDAPFLGYADNHYELTVQPLTGRTFVTDRSTNAP